MKSYQLPGDNGEDLETTDVLMLEGFVTKRGDVALLRKIRHKAETNFTKTGFQDMGKIGSLMSPKNLSWASIGPRETIEEKKILDSAQSPEFKVGRFARENSLLPRIRELKMKSFSRLLRDVMATADLTTRRKSRCKENQDD